MCYLPHIIFISVPQILAANKDTCDDTELPTMYDLIDDALAIGVDDEGWEAEYICIQKKDRNK